MGVPNVRKNGTMGAKRGQKCAQRPEKRDDGNEKGAKVCPVSGKMGHWEQGGGERRREEIKLSGGKENI